MGAQTGHEISTDNVISMALCKTTVCGNSCASVMELPQPCFEPLIDIFFRYLSSILIDKLHNDYWNGTHLLGHICFFHKKALYCSLLF